MVFLHRLGEAERRPGAGALPGRYLPLRHHLPGLPHAHQTRQAGWSLWLCEAAAPSHLAQPGLHGPAAAVWDRRAVLRVKLEELSMSWLLCTMLSLNFESELWGTWLTETYQIFLLQMEELSWGEIGFCASWCSGSQHDSCLWYFTRACFLLK